jgi:hypothetical protein
MRESELVSLELGKKKGTELSVRMLGFVMLHLAVREASATNGYFLEGYGTNAKAQAGVGIALPLDSLTIATNPAGLTEVADSVTAGVEIFRPRRSAPCANVS